MKTQLARSFKMINGTTPVVGDLLFDIMRRATCTVVRSTPQGLTVDFGAGVGTMNVNTDGTTAAGVRRLYWQDPILVEPQKNDPNWNAYRTILEVVQAQMNIDRQ